MKYPTLALFVVLLSSAFPSVTRGAEPLADTPNADLLDRLLQSVPPDQRLIQIGDMQLLAEPLRQWRRGFTGGPGLASAFDAVAPLWPGGNLYYTVDPSVTPENRRAFLDAAAEWAMFANLHFIPRTTQPNYFTLLEDPALGGGQSAVGMVGGQQFLKIGPGAWNRGTLCHELGHTLGLIHEHQRTDRDDYITILTANLIPGTEPDFVKLPGSKIKGPYDLLSVMHYRRDAFSSNPASLNTIVPLPAYSDYLDLIGQQNDPVLSPLDRAGIALVYGAGPNLSSIVTNTLESGPGSLRAALYVAWDQPGTTITFNIPNSDPGFAGGVFTIRPTDRLPGLIHRTTLDGSSQPGNSNPAGPEIVLDGSYCQPASVYADGLHFKGSNCVARGLIVHSFPGAGVLFDSPLVRSNTLAGCFVGLDPSGHSSRTNRYANIVISGGASDNIIGGLKAQDRNVISGSSDQGISINGPTTRRNRILGNYIGLSADGEAAVANNGAGVNLFDGAHDNVIGGAEAASRNVISGNTYQGIAISSPGAVRNLVQGNFLGTDPSGTRPLPNQWSGVALFGGATSNVIGGDSAAARNIISGNALQGMTLSDSATHANLIAGNYIGIDAVGQNAVPNGWSGIQLYGGASSNQIGGTTAALRNVVSGNTFQGIVLTDPGTSGNVIAGNYVGLLPDGTTPAGNGWSGIELSLGASENVVGGSDAKAGNTIARNGNYGVVIGGNGSSRNIVSGNQIGTTASGNEALGNSWSGVGLYGGASENVIGGTSVAAGNIISGNANYGVSISGGETAHNRVMGNTIGTDTSGAARIGNSWDGIGLNGGAHDNQIGLSVTGEGLGNVIQFNTLSGIVLFNDATQGNTLRGNRVGSNGQLGINLVGASDGAYGVTFNDFQDADSGPNSRQNFPVLTDAVSHGVNTSISGTLNSTPSRKFVVDLYRNTTPTPSGYGDTPIWIASTDVTTDQDGNGSFSLTVPIDLVGDYLASTATDTTTGDTSEASFQIRAILGSTPPTFVSPAVSLSGFEASIRLTAGETYRIQATTNLSLVPIPWLDLTNVVGGSEIYRFLDPSNTNFNTRFYRVLSP